MKWRGNWYVMRRSKIHFEAFLLTYRTAYVFFSLISEKKHFNFLKMKVVIPKSHTFGEINVALIPKWSFKISHTLTTRTLARNRNYWFPGQAYLMRHFRHWGPLICVLTNYLGSSDCDTQLTLRTSRLY